MKIYGMRITGVLAACLLGLVWLAQPVRLMGQTTAPAAAPAPGTAGIHGHVNDPTGVPLTSGEVRLTTDKNPNTVDRKFEYSFPIDASGNYKGDGIKPGNYVAAVFQNNNTVDFMPAPMTAGEDKTVDFDMSRKAYIDKMSPAERDQMEELKKQNAATMAKNAKIENLNAMMKQANADMQAGNYASAVKTMTDATAAKPDEAILWETLGDAQSADATAADKAAKASHTTDATVPDKLAAAVDSYQKALAMNAASAKPRPELPAAANNQLGAAYGRLAMASVSADKRTDAMKSMAAAYDAAAKADPKGAAKYYYNESVMLYNVTVTPEEPAGLVDAAAKALVVAADNVIAADPTKADAYYLKTQGLAPQITMGPDGKTLVAPPGLVDACNMYLKLAPAGVHAADMKGILAGLQEQVQTNYKAPPAPKRK
jgi:hypothetical protein